MGEQLRIDRECADGLSQLGGRMKRLKKIEGEQLPIDELLPEVDSIDIKLSSSEKLTRARAEIAAQDKADNKE